MKIQRWEVVAWALLLVWIWVSRWAVAPDILYEWDSVNYALGLREFDIYQHQPHPPGYPIFILLLRVLNWLPGSETTPFLLANGLFSSGSLLLLGWMSRGHTGPLIAVLLGAAFSVSPQFWYQGAVSTAYVAECFCSVACAALALALARGKISYAAAALLLALILGTRPNGLLSLTPVVLLGALLRWQGWRQVAAAAGLMVSGCALWIAGLIFFGGGWEPYREASNALVGWQMNIGSILQGNFIIPIVNFLRLGRYLLDSMNILWLALILNGILVLVTRARNRRTLWLFLAWALPGAGVYIFHHLPKSAYVLTLAPAGYLAAAVALGAALPRLARGWRAFALMANGILLAGYLLLNTVAFFIAVPSDLVRYKDAHIAAPERPIILGDYGRLGLQYRAYPHLRTREILKGLDPKRDLAVFLFGTHELHRFECFYHPGHWMITASVNHQRALVNPPTKEWPDSFGDFQTTMLKPPLFGRMGFGATCIHGAHDRLIFSKGDRDFEIFLSRVPRRVVVFYFASAFQVKLGTGLSHTRPVHVGAGYMATEFQLDGLDSAMKTVSMTPGERRHFCYEPETD